MSTITMVNRNYKIKHGRYWMAGRGAWDAPYRASHSQISVGLEKGMMAFIKNYADDQFIERNNFIIAHEMLHTLGASDKYDPVTLMPLYPQGYATPSLGQYKKQDKCEIMGGRIPFSDTLAITPKSLNYCMIGNTTAKEIGWIK